MGSAQVGKCLLLLLVDSSQAKPWTWPWGRAAVISKVLLIGSKGQQIGQRALANLGTLATGLAQ